MSIAFDGLKEDQYRIGDYQAIRYDPKREPFFDGYIGKFYNLCRESKRRSGDGILTAVFGGNPPSTFDAIVSYLAQRPLIVMGEWLEDGTFKEGGFAFPIIFCGIEPPERSCFAGYGFLQHTWGKPELPIMAMLGLAYLFNEFGVKALHGTRYEDNTLTARFTRQFGFKEVGRIPYYQLRDGVLVSAVVTTLERDDFEHYVETFLVERYRAEQAKIAMVGTVQHPAIEESPETIDAQMAALIDGHIPVVFFPQDSQYLPALPEGIKGQVEAGCPGAGVYYFNPSLITGEQITAAAKAGTHHQLLGHIQNKTDVLPKSCVVQAQTTDGTILQDSLVSADVDAIIAQMDAFEKRFPGCKCRILPATKVIEQRIAAAPKEKPQEPVQQSLAWM